MAEPGDSGASERQAKHPDRPLDVLQRLLADVFKGEIEPIAEVVAHRARDGDAAGRRDALQPGGHIDAVAENVVALDDDIADIDADAEFDAAAFRDIGVALAHLALDLSGAGDRIHHARKLDQHAVAGQLDDATLVLGDLGVEKLLAMRVERRERRRLIDAHEPAVADHVGGQNSGQTAFHVVPASGLSSSVLARCHKLDVCSHRCPL